VHLYSGQLSLEPIHWEQQYARLNSHQTKDPRFIELVGVVTPTLLGVFYIVNPLYYLLGGDKRSSFLLTLSLIILTLILEQEGCHRIPQPPQPPQDIDIGFINPPRIVSWLQVRTASLIQFWGILLDPTRERTVIDFHSAITDN